MAGYTQTDGTLERVREVLLLCWRDTRHPQGGGSELYLERVGEELAARGVRVTLRTAMYPGAARSETVRGVRISRGGGRFTVYPLALLAIVLARFGRGPLRGIRPDAVIDTQNGIPFFARLVAGVPVTVLVHHCHREQWPVAGRLVARIGWFIESRLSPWVHRASQYLTVSLPSAEELALLGVGPERVAVVRNGIDSVSPGSRTCVRCRRGWWCCPGSCRTSRSRTPSTCSPACATASPICISTSSAAGGGTPSCTRTPRSSASSTG
ncbi:hypothetical protein MTP03_02970 [Tsukamurella sp. PLM1]|nr:hypothetical protein MTP03_02970 [Tsukamurella sp. PLM1]